MAGGVGNKKVPPAHLVALCDAPERFEGQEGSVGRALHSPGHGRCVPAALVQASVSFVGNKNYWEGPIANVSSPFLSILSTCICFTD